MSDTQDLRIEPAAPTGVVEATRPELPERRPSDAPEPQPEVERPVAAATEGQMRNAYAEFVVDSETHNVVVRIRDAVTDRVLQELPGPEVQRVMRSLNDYAELLARRRAVAQAMAGY
jgi:hypothetical protein